MSTISCFSSISSAVSTVGSTYGSSVFGSNIVFSFINRFAYSFSISLSLQFPKVACFNKIDNLAVRSLTPSNLKSLAPLKLL